jgi:hypothetical protein
VAILPSGRWLAVFADVEGGGGERLYSSFSDDGGLTWSAPVDLGFNGLAASLLVLQSGNVLLVSSQRAVHPTAVQCRLSRDNGATFSAPYLLYYAPSDSPNFGYTAPVQLPDPTGGMNGLIVMTHYIPGVDADHAILFVSSLYENQVPV